MTESSDSELNRPVLRETISHLQDRKAPGSVWHSIDRVLDGKTNRSRLWPAIGVAATFLLLWTAWIGLPSLEYIPPIAETEVSVIVPSAATLTEWQENKEAEEARVFACLDSTELVPAVDSLTARYQEIIVALDSLTFLLQEPAPHAATTGRFKQLELSRKRTLAKIEQQGCKKLKDAE
ncbi:MAG: hypothetical protein NWR72_13220 [Bacteroidia bacterium]|nr:hypothetical protein [Bacteroidia bacterium]